MKIGFRVLNTLVISAALLIVPGLAAADKSAADKADSSSQQFTDKQLKRFVQAQEDVQAAMQKWQSRLDKADEDDKARLQEKRNEDMAKAVEDSGLDPQTYNEIAQQSQQDKQLTQRIQDFMTPQ